MPNDSELRKIVETTKFKTNNYEENIFIRFSGTRDAGVLIV